MGGIDATRGAEPERKDSRQRAEQYRGDRRAGERAMARSGRGSLSRGVGHETAAGVAGERLEVESEIARGLPAITSVTVKKKSIDVRTGNDVWKRPKLFWMASDR